MEKFRSYLAKAVALFRTRSPESRVSLVLGNVSNDMDSVVGSMTLAYYYFLKHQKVFVPVLNVQKHNFSLRIEIVKHLGTTLLD